MNASWLARLTALLLLTCLLGTPPALAGSDIILDWNLKADAIAGERSLSPPVHARGLALMHVAMFEAVNAVERKYTPYKLKLAAEPGTSVEAAAASAAYEILAALYPEQRSALEAELAKSLASLPPGPPRDKGLALGKKAAEGMLALRAQDGSDARESYRPFTTPGRYVSTAMAISSTIGGITPWVMTSGSQFRPAPPPALDSETWTRDVNEIREIGGRDSTRRTAEQTDIGRFWYVNGGRAYNPVIRQVAKSKTPELADCARLFALASLAAADAFTAVFEAKYQFNFWRPITAIRNADITGNAATPRDASWLPLGETPLHPEYPCAHCIASQAVASVLQAVVGNEIGEITMTSASAPGVTRKWTRLQDYSDEVSNARIYAGFHYRFSTEAAKDMGRKVGELAVSTQLLPVKHRAR